jgi:hypothetical protein
MVNQVLVALDSPFVREASQESQINEVNAIPEVDLTQVFMTKLVKGECEELPYDPTMP